MRLRLTWLALVASVAARTRYELDARKAWEPGSEEFDEVVDQTIIETPSRTRTECYSGNEKYVRQSVLCDRECLKDVEAVTRASGLGGDTDISELQCNGPWYCSRTEVCELYRNEADDELASFERSCTVVYGCANHSQCFPTPEEQRRMKIQMPDSLQPKDILREGFTTRYGGVTMRTTCCVNNRGRQKGYRLFINQPCNAALGRTVGLALWTVVVSTVAVLLTWTWAW